MSDDYKIYVDGGAPATLNDGAGISTDCATLQEAVSAWQRLTPEQKIRATVKLIGGPVYTAHQIARSHGRSPGRRSVAKLLTTDEAFAKLPELLRRA
jgi:hypothetical protein